jgi:hypothetical protein
VRRSPLLLLAGFCLSGCLTTVEGQSPPVYHNPLDILDSGVPPLPDSGPRPDGGDGGGLSPGPDGTAGTVGSRTPLFTSATYQVVTSGGPARTAIYIADVADLCSQVSDGGLGQNWNLLRLHLAGDTPAGYTVAAILPPAGATAEFDFQDTSGAYGIYGAVGGTVQLDGIDPGNAQTSTGTYTLDFGDAGSLRGRFTAAPCSVVPLQPGG